MRRIAILATIALAFFSLSRAFAAGAGSPAAHAAKPASIEKLRKLADRIRARKSGVIVKTSRKASSRKSNRVTRATALRTLYRQMAAADYKACLSSNVQPSERALVASGLKRLRVAGERSAWDDVPFVDNGAAPADACGCSNGTETLGDDSYGLCYCAQNDNSAPAKAGRAFSTPMDAALEKIEPVADDATRKLASRETPKSGSRTNPQAAAHYKRALAYERMADAATRPAFPATPVGRDGKPDISRLPTSASLSKLASQLRVGQGPVYVLRAAPKGGFRSVAVPRAAALKRTYQMMAALDYRASLLAGLPAKKEHKVISSLWRLHNSAVRSAIIRVPARKSARKSSRKAGAKFADDEGDGGGGDGGGYSAPAEEEAAPVYEEPAPSYDPPPDPVEEEQPVAVDETPAPVDDNSYAGASEDAFVAPEQPEEAPAPEEPSAPADEQAAAPDEQPAPLPDEQFAPLPDDQPAPPPADPDALTPVVDPGTQDPAPDGTSAFTAQDQAEITSPVNDAPIVGLGDAPTTPAVDAPIVAPVDAPTPAPTDMPAPTPPDAQTPATGDPKTPAPPDSQTPATGDPKAPTPPDAQTPATGDPKAPTPPDAQTPATGDPKTPTPPDAQTPATGDPKTPTPPDAQTPATGDPKAPTPPDAQTPPPGDQNPPPGAPNSPDQDTESGAAGGNTCTFGICGSTGLTPDEQGTDWGGATGAPPSLPLLPFPGDGGGALAPDDQDTSVVDLRPDALAPAPTPTPAPMPDESDTPAPTLDAPPAPVDAPAVAPPDDGEAPSPVVYVPDDSQNKKPVTGYCEATEDGFVNCHPQEETISRKAGKGGVVRSRVSRIMKVCPAASKAIHSPKGGFAICAAPVQRKSAKLSGLARTTNKPLYNRLAKLDRTAGKVSSALRGRTATRAQAARLFAERAWLYESMAASIGTKRGAVHARKSAKTSAPTAVKAKAGPAKAAPPIAAPTPKTKPAKRVSDDAAPVPPADSVKPAPPEDPLKRAEQGMEDMEKDMRQKIKERSGGGQ